MEPITINLDRINNNRFCDVLTLNPEEIKEDVPEGDWVRSQKIGIKNEDVGTRMQEMMSAVKNDQLDTFFDSDPNEIFERMHLDGWTIKGVMCNDWYSWVEVFEATHPQFGKVWRTEEDAKNHTVKATTREAYDNFIINHEFIGFCYDDI